MKRDKLFRLSLAILFLWTSLALAAPAAMAASSTALPGSSLWEPYLQQSRIDLEKAASSPWETLKSFLPRSFGALVRQTASRYTSVLLFLTLTAVLGLLAGECTDGALLDLVAAGGCGVLLWGNLLEEAQKLCEQVGSWRSFLLGFLPVYAGVLTMGGEGAAGSAASGALLTALCFLAQLAAAFVQPLLHCYLMLSMACCVSSEPALGVFCKGVGSALRQALGWAGKILVALLGLQRAAAFQLDRFSLRTGQLLAGSVPIIGQTLSSASESILAGIQLLKSGLGLAALSVLGAEFVPLYLGLMIQLALLMGCSLLCSLTGISRCRALFDCFAEAVRCMAAVVALFFGLAAAGVALLFIVGGGYDAGTGTGSGSLLYGLYLRRAALPLCRAGLGAEVHKSGGGAIYSSSLCGCSARRKGTVYRIGTAAGAGGLGRQSGGCCSGTDGRRTLPYSRRTLSQRGGRFAQAEYQSEPDR